MADHAVATTTEHEHPGPETYVKVAIVLTAITAIEVAIYYMDWIRDHSLLVPLLIIFSAIKFVTVVGYFMHLKFDDSRFRTIFVAGLVLSIAVMSAVIVLLRTHRIDYGLTDLLT